MQGVRILLAAFVVSLAGAARVKAQFVWNGQGTTATAITGSNWSGGTAPTGTAGTESVTFGVVTPSQTTQSVTLPSSGIVLNNLTFDGGSSRPIYTFTGGSQPLVIYGQATIDSGSNVTFDATAPLRLTAGSHQVSIGASTTLFSYSVISETGGAASINKTGLGTLRLIENNTFTGGITLTGGFVDIESAASLGSGSAALTFAGGTLRTLNAMTIARPITVGSNGGTINTNSKNITLSGIISGSGNLLLTGGAATVLTAANTMTGTLTVKEGELRIGDGTTGSFDGNLALDNSGSNNPRITFARSNAYTYSGVISGSSSSTLAVAVNDNGPVTFTGHHTYTAPTSITGSLILASGATLGTGTVAVSGGNLTLLSGASIGNTVNVSSSGKLAGTGTITNGNIQSTGILAPSGASGNLIGSLTFSDLTLSGGGIYEWNLKSPTGVAGTDWDLVTINTPTTLTISATAGTPFNLKLISVNSAGSVGTAAGFAQQNYVWKIFDTSSTTISPAFDATFFSIDSSQFTTNLGSGGTFSFYKDSSTHNLMLSFTPVPEPETYVLMGTGLSLLAGAAWRRRRRR